MNDRRLPVRLLAGITIATIGLELPVLAVPQPAPVLVAQVACVIRKKTAVYTTANPQDPEVQGRTLAVDTAVGLAAPLPTVPPARVQIKPNGFVDYAALDCGREQTSPSSPQKSVCRKVRDTVTLKYVLQEPKGEAQMIAPVAANMSVWVTQTDGLITSRRYANGEAWVEVDLQRTFGKNFGISSSVGWLSNTDPDNPMSTLVNGCSR